MAWFISLHPAIEAELEGLPEAAYDKLVACLLVLREGGPQLGRPIVDTLNGSSFANMKELRFKADGVWRFAFAFDPQQQAIILIGGNKEGAKETRFYKQLIALADARYSAHLKELTGKKGANK